MTEARRPRVVAFAYSGFGHAGLRALLRSGAEVALVFSHHDHPGENIWWPSVAKVCSERGIAVEFDADLRDPALVARIRDLAPDFLFSFYYRKMIPGRVLKLAKRGGYNLHGSLLPKYRGRAPLNWQLVHGEAETGLTLHRMVVSADAGDIVAQQAMAVGPDEDAFAVVNRLLELAPAFLDRAFADLFAGRAVHRAQDHGQATVFGGRTPTDGQIDWAWPARRVHNLVRAVAKPFPGAFTWQGDRQVLVWRTRVINETTKKSAPGTVLAEGVACGEGMLEVLEASDSEGKTFVPTPGMRFSLTPSSRMIVPQ